jgi:hypothetical protein
MTTAKDLRMIFSDMRTERTAWEHRYQSISDNQLARADFSITNKNQPPRDSKIYDGTSMDSWFMLTNAIQAILMNTESNWIYLDTLAETELSDDEILWLDNAREQTQNLFRLDISRFPAQMNETLGDLTGFGMGAIHSEYRTDLRTIVFSSRPLPEIYIDQDQSGVIDRIYRKYPLRNMDAEAIFGDAVPTKVKEANKHGKGREEQYWIQAFNPHPDEFGKFIAYHLLEDEYGDIVRTDFYDELPIHVGRWRTDAGEKYARGPGVVADAFARTLNEVVKTWLKQAQKAVDPPLLVADDGVVQGPDTRPGAQNVVTAYAPGNQEPIRPLPPGANFSVANQEIERLQMSIRKAYHHDILQITDSKELTAFHVQELTQRAQQWIAPVLQRVKTELVQPMVERALKLQIRNNMLPKAPDGLNEKGLKIVYISPAQRASEMQEAEATMRAVERVIALAEVHPEILDNYDFDAMARSIHHTFAADPKVLKRSRDVRKIRTEREEAKQNRQQQDDALALGAAGTALAGQSDTAIALNSIRGGK